VGVVKDQGFIRGCLWTLIIILLFAFWLCSDVRTGVAHVIVQMVVVQNCILMGYFFIIEYTKWLFDETKKI